MASTSLSVRVLLVDEQPVMLCGLRLLFESECPRIEVVGATSSRAEAQLLAQEKRPDVILLDLHLSELVPGLIADGHARVILHASQREQEEAVGRAVIDGARGVVYKEDPLSILPKAIIKVYEGELWLDRRTVSRLLFEVSSSGGKGRVDDVAEKIESLTPKERIVITAFARMPGAPNKKFAEHLCMSEHTLRNHLTSIFDKLELNGRFELFEFAKHHHNRFLETLKPLRKSGPGRSREFHAQSLREEIKV